MNSPTNKSLIGIHQHTAVGSLLDGASHVKDYVQFAVDNELPMVGISDHGWTCGFYDLDCECSKHKIKGMFGVEIFLIPDPDYVRNENQKDLNYFHLSLWALNQVGYQSLSALASKSWTNTFRNRPLVSWQMLGEHSEGVACGSGCLLGPVAYPFIRGEKEEGVKALCRLKEMFPDRLFMEIMPHAVDRNYTGKDGELISVMGEDNVVYRFDPKDMLDTNVGRMTAKEAMEQNVSEIYSSLPIRVQDGKLINNQ